MFEVATITILVGIIGYVYREKFLTLKSQREVKNECS